MASTDHYEYNFETDEWTGGPDALHETLEAWFDDPIAAGYEVESRSDPFLIPMLWGMEDFYRIALAMGFDNKQYHDTIVDAMIITEHAASLAKALELPFSVVAGNMLEVMNASERERKYYALVHPRDEANDFLKARVHLNIARSTLMITILEPIAAKTRYFLETNQYVQYAWREVIQPTYYSIRHGLSEVKSMLDGVIAGILHPINQCLTAAVSYLKRRRKQREEGSQDETEIG